MTELNKLNMETRDLCSDNFNKFEQLFPNCVTENKDDLGNIVKTINFDLLKQIVGIENAGGGKEYYQFTWPGKKASIQEANTSITKSLRPSVEDSKDWEDTKNIYIEGDNLETLKILQDSYLGKIKMIYIDPPYNTGHEFVYKDKFVQSEEEFSDSLGDRDDEGRRLFSGVNQKSNPKFHSLWCSMIYSRLLLARSLLSEDGAIFISIDDNEQQNMKNMCNEVFGENNFVAQIVWEKVHTRKNSALYFSSSHEYILVYAKLKKLKSNDSSGFSRNLLPRDSTDAYSNPDNDPKGPWKADPITAHNYYSADYTIKKPNGIVVERPKDRYWAYSEEVIKKKIEENAIIWGNGDSIPMVKRYLCDVQDGLVPTTLFFSRNYAGDTSQAKTQLDSLFPEAKGIFDYSKSLKLLQRLLQIGTNKNDVVLDFFSGSATTAHAVMKLNAEDGGKRHFIMVQLPELCHETSVAFKAGYKNICEIGKERIRRAGEQIKKAHPETNVDVGFRVFKVDSSNMKDVYYNPEFLSQDLLLSLESNIKEDRSDLDLLFGCILDLGLTLDKEVKEETIGDTKVYIYNDDEKEGPDLIACFADSITEDVITAIAKRNPLKAVFKDSSFENSPSKINLFELFKTYANISDDNELQSRVRVI